MTRPTPLMASIAILITCGAAIAETCTFTSECFEADGCADTNFEMTVADGQMVTDAETIPATRGGSSDVHVYVGVTDNAFHLLTKTADNSARYTTHIYDGPMMISYLGTCTP